MGQDAMIQPVFHPAVPAEVRDALAGLRERLPPAPGVVPAWMLPGWRRRAGQDAVRALGLGAVCALLPVILAFTRMFGWAGRVTAVVAQAILVALWLASFWFSDPWVAIAGSGLLQVLCTVGGFVLMDAWQLRRGVRRAGGRYLVDGDFDQPSRFELARAQTAIGTVTGSAVAAAGLLDEAANDVVLSWQEWEIAGELARGPGRRGGRISGPVALRIEALERYAAQVQEADAALTRRTSPGTGVVGAGEAAVLAEIDDLADRARLVRDALWAAHDGAAPAPEPLPGDG